ncbi:unnamed protein product [Adineta steineri]|uniref:Uncharacterized protein n=1 Tax=Adineta steineri TaxID=433720 RepID=A0A814DJM6_9BILA|nr:unnamed protein product [Adineta steineri]CAF0953858.1 unnamed protein product [Adineta steineri]CAF3752544.1 unnamed protein product [Adineta steineri]
MTNIDIHVEGLDELIDRTVTRIIDEIDPTLAKFQNISLQLLSTVETRIKTNISETLYYLETNLFFLLFAIIIFIILLLIMFWLLESVMKNFGFTLATRKFTGLAVSTFIFIWLFIATILSTFPPVQPVDLQTLKHILFGVLCAATVVMVFIWIRWICVHRKCIKIFFANELFNFQATENQIVPLSATRVIGNGIPLNPMPTNREHTEF